MKNLLLLTFLTLGLYSFSQPQVIVDPNFSIGSGFSNIVYSNIIQPDGKIICGGAFTSFNGVARNRVARLNADGTLDASFNPATGFNGIVYSLSLQPDGKIICGGAFTSFNGIARNSIARLNADGSLDASFNPATGFNIGLYIFGVKSMVLQPDGKIICGGDFTSFNGVNRNRIARLNTDGTLDTSFNPGTGFMDGVSQYVCVFAIVLQPDGKIICGGEFSSFNGVNKNGMVRLNTSGSLDATFTDNGLPAIMSMTLRPNGKIIAGADGALGINSNGTIDFSFNMATTPGGILWSIALQPDGKIIFGGDFTSCNGANRNRIARLNADGTLDASFDPGIGFNGIDYSLSLQSNGKLICGGDFTSFNGVARNRIARLELGYQTSFSITTNCFGDNYLWNTQNYSQTGVYSQVLVAQDGLDSVVTLNLTSPAPISSLLSDVFCPQISYVWNNQSYNQPGQYTQLLSAQNGCDSTVTLNLTYATPIASSFSDYFCPGGFYLWNNQTYNQPGQYSQLFSAQNGCDSTVIVNLTFLPNNYNPTFSSTQQLYTAPPFAVQFSNSTANASNYSFIWDFGDGTTLASNNASVFHQYLYNGQYTVSLIATNNATGCSDTTTLSDYIFCTGGVSCTHSATINQTSPQQTCHGTPFWLSCNSDPSYSYQWRKNGVLISGNNNDSIQVTLSGTYSVIISVNNCPVSSSDVVVNILPAPTTPIITSTGVIQACVGGSVTLNTGSYTTYNWSTGATTQSINVSNSGTYSVSVTDANGCSSSSNPLIINASFVASPQVCIVGMDSLTNENRVVWEKPLTQGIDSFYVYKESNVSNVYTKIGATDYIALAIFLDVNSNPAVQAYRYKISALDTCGVETNVGDFHKTVHLTINQGIGGAWNLIWSHYEGLNFGSYNIYRGTNPSNISLLSTIQSNLNSYTDLTPLAGPLYYQIEVVNPVNCDPTKNLNYGVSKSNVVNNGQVGVEDIKISNIYFYPNPTSDAFTVETIEDLNSKSFIIYDVSGRILSTGKLVGNKTTIQVSSLSTGSYYLNFPDTNQTLKFIKE
jgi:uncharacterized delta-60 repeat protein